MARNAALALADSKYICFVDSDDYLAPTFLQELYQAITIHDADIACCYYYYHFVESDSLYKYPFRTSGVFNKEEAFEKTIKKMYKFKVLPGIKFINVLCLWTTVLHSLLWLLKIWRLLIDYSLMPKKVVVINRALYYYNQQSASTLATINAQKINDFILATAMVRASLDKTVFMTNIKKRIVLLPKRQAGIVYIAH